jgi:hypothetical protein
MKRVHLYAFVLLLLLVASPRISLAHPSPSSRVVLDLGVHDGALIAEVPREELQQARAGEPTDEGSLSRYFQEHTHPVSTTGHPWTVGSYRIHEEARETGPVVIAEARLVPPPGEANAPFLLGYDAVCHQVRSHYVQIGIRNDWYAGLLGTEITPVATLHFSKTDVTIPRGKADFLQGLKRAIALGASHIANGIDHLLFLLVLVLPTFGGARNGTRTTALKRLAASLSAFTVGHATTLIFAAKSWISVPARPIEIAVALSIVGTALVVAQETFQRTNDAEKGDGPAVSRDAAPSNRTGPRYLLPVTGLFGLIHGLAFAEVFSGNAPATMRSMWTLAAFNIGVELQQIVIVAAVAPWLFLLAKSSHYRLFQRFTALASAGVALVWTVARLCGLSSSCVDAPLEALSRHPLLALGLLIVVVAIARRTGPVEPARAADEATSSSRASSARPLSP